MKLTRLEAIVLLLLVVAIGAIIYPIVAPTPKPVTRIDANGHPKLVTVEDCKAWFDSQGWDSQFCYDGGKR